MIEREEIAGDVVVLRLARPPVNALDVPTLRDLAAALRAAEYSAVVLTGAGGAFTGGADVKAVAAA